MIEYSEILHFLLPVLKQAGIYAVTGITAVIALLLIVYLLRNLVWQLRYPFFMLNWLQWICYNPIRDQWRFREKKHSHFSFLMIMLSGLGPLWWIMMHIALTPVRIVNAIYFNMILYFSTVMCDSIAELFHPTRNRLRRLSGVAYLRQWLRGFPKRLMNVFTRNGLAILEGFLMTGVDTVLPTYTMFHGTSFKGIATNIAQNGRWLVGSGDYAGSGIYFGFYKKTAEHYAKEEDHAIIVARVTLFPCRNSSTFPPRLRRMIGQDGVGITRDIGFLWKSIEHWRDHSYAQWFEYCLLQRDKAGEYVRTWRARPIAVLKHNHPSRIWGGLSLWTSGAGGVSAIVFSWLILILIGYVIIHYNP